MLPVHLTYASKTIFIDKNIIFLFFYLLQSNNSFINLNNFPLTLLQDHSCVHVHAEHEPGHVRGQVHGLRRCVRHDQALRVEKVVFRPLKHIKILLRYGSA